MACKFVFEYLSVLFLQFITLTPTQKWPAPLSNEATQSTDHRVIYLISNQLLFDKFRNNLHGQFDNTNDIF